MFLFHFFSPPLQHVALRVDIFSILGDTQEDDEISLHHFPTTHGALVEHLAMDFFVFMVKNPYLRASGPRAQPIHKASGATKTVQLGTPGFIESLMKPTGESQTDFTDVHLHHWNTEKSKQ